MAIGMTYAKRGNSPVEYIYIYIYLSVSLRNQFLLTTKSILRTEILKRVKFLPKKVVDNDGSCLTVIKMMTLPHETK